MRPATTSKDSKAGLTGLFLWCAVLTVSIGIDRAFAESLVLEVARAHSAFDQRTKEPMVAFTLTEASKRMFADFTARHIGQVIEIRVDGRIINRPVIRQPIVGGLGQLVGLNADDVKDIVDRLSSGSARMEVEAVPN